MAARTRGEPARLNAATLRLRAAHRPVRSQLWSYRGSLRRLIEAPSDVPVTAPDRSSALDDHLDDLDRLARTPAAFATALRQLDRFVPDTPTDRLWLATSDQGTFDAIVEAALDDPDATPSELWAHTPAAIAARADLLDLLDGGRLGVTTGDLDDILALIERTPAAVVAGMFHGLTDGQVEDLVDAAEPHWLPWRGWDADERHQLWTALGRKVSIESWDRLAGFTDDLDPPPVTVMDDPAAGRTADRAFFEGLEYGEVGEWLTWRGEGDGHAVAGNDVTQGRIGNCYLVAAMIGVADRDPDLLRQMIRSNPNGTYTVRFADGVEVTVSATFPVNPNDPDRPAFASRVLGPDDRDTTDGLELWPLVIEKAYAQRHGGWGDIVGGWPGATVQELVGGEHREIEVAEVELAELRRRLDGGEALTLSTLPSGRVSDDGADLYERVDGLVGQHAYVLAGITASGRLTLTNPWDPTDVPVRLTLAEAQLVGWKIEANQLP